jgi:hypothetical protein
MRFSIAISLILWPQLGFIHHIARLHPESLPTRRRLRRRSSNHTVDGCEILRQLVTIGNYEPLSTMGVLNHLITNLPTGAGVMFLLLLSTSGRPA